MAASTITQRITLEGAEEIKRTLADIGKTGEQALRQIQDAGKGADFGKDLTGEFAKVEKAAKASASRWVTWAGRHTSSASRSRNYSARSARPRPP